MNYNGITTLYNKKVKYQVNLKNKIKNGPVKITRKGNTKNFSENVVEGRGRGKKGGSGVPKLQCVGGVKSSQWTTSSPQVYGVH